MNEDASADRNIKRERNTLKRNSYKNESSIEGNDLKRKNQKSRIIKQAFIRSIPVMAGYIILGTGFGILLRNAGYGVPWAFAMSALIYAGSLQYVGAGLISGGATILTTALTSFMVNARHLFYSISMMDKYMDGGKYKPYMVLSLTDETYSLLCDGRVPSEEYAGLYRFMVSLFDHSYWVAGSVLGSLLGSVLPFPTKGIEFSMTALFIASYTEQWLSTDNHIPALTGAVCSVLSLILFGPDHFLIPAMLMITFVVTILRGKMEGVHGSEERQVKE